jgi:RNA polymerase sigma factor (sigma-70 family)
VPIIEKRAEIDPAGAGAMTLEELAARAVAGDRAALEAVCRELQAPMYRLALRMLGGAQDAEDATQEILVVIATHLSQFRGDSKLTTWAYTIASRHLLGVRRTRAEDRAVPVGELAALIDAGLAATTAQSLPEGDAAVLARDVQRTCSQAMLFALSREERHAVVLVEMLGASDALGAAICEVREDAFRQRLSRGRAKLAPVLAARCGLADVGAPCTCARQAAAKQRAGIKLPVYRDPAGAARADAELGQLGRLRGLFAIDPPPVPQRDAWAALVARFPDLLGAEAPCSR